MAVKDSFAEILDHAATFQEAQAELARTWEIGGAALDGIERVAACLTVSAVVRTALKALVDAPITIAGWFHRWGTEGRAELAATHAPLPSLEQIGLVLLFTPVIAALEALDRVAAGIGGHNVVSA